MNKVILTGRLTDEPVIRYAQGNSELEIARFTLAVDRRFKKEGEQSADFIGCISFGKLAEHARKYYKKGTKITICGRIQTGSYTNKDGQKVYTTDVVIEEQEFAESKAVTEARTMAEARAAVPPSMPTDSDGFMDIPDGISEELPFN